MGVDRRERATDRQTETETEKANGIEDRERETETETEKANGIKVEGERQTDRDRESE